METKKVICRLETYIRNIHWKHKMETCFQSTICVSNLRILFPIYFDVSNQKKLFQISFLALSSALYGSILFNSKNNCCSICYRSTSFLRSCIFPRIRCYHFRRSKEICYAVWWNIIYARMVNTCSISQNFAVS